ncbi:MAG: homoserine O-acetyltransferase [Prevotellaceae bacterium]|jgi:homoserine O-acetyltransferase|nr:homoserine O-acetyltransferase [Prevotellaceae bacterium]
MIQQFFTYEGTFDLEGGGSLPEVNVCYYVSGAHPEGKKVVWICHALTANANPEEWWPNLVGPGKYFDTDKYFIICANILTSCYGTTGPQDTNPATGKPYLLEFPLVSIRDMVKAHELLRRHLGISQIDLLIGGSSGGFQAVEWAISNPGVIKNLCLICCNARVSAWGTAFNESQRMALMADESFTAQTGVDGGKKGLECARSVALLTYRSYAGYAKTQSEDDENCLLAKKACSYQQYQGKKLSNRFNAYSYYYLTLGLDTHNVGRGRGGVRKALSGITANTLCIAIDSDMLFPVCEAETMAAHIPGASLEIISSDFGHDGFLLEYAQLSKAIEKKLKI